MSYKTILVHIDSGSHCATRVDVAMRLARQHDSHLVALHAIAPFEPPGYVMAEMGPAILDAQKHAAALELARSETEFTKQATAAGFTNISMLGGGIDACKKAGLSVIAGRKVLPIFQQVMIAAGTLILTGLLLGRVHPAFYLIDWFVACGMVFAGITGFCGMAKLLERMPWNQVQPVGAAPAPAASSGSCCAATSSCCISKPQGVKP